MVFWLKLKSKTNIFRKRKIKRISTKNIVKKTRNRRKREDIVKYN